MMRGGVVHARMRLRMRNQEEINVPTKNPPARCRGFFISINLIENLVSDITEKSNILFQIILNIG